MPKEKACSKCGCTIVVHSHSLHLDYLCTTCVMDKTMAIPYILATGERNE